MPPKGVGKNSPASLHSPSLPPPLATQEEAQQFQERPLTTTRGRMRLIVIPVMYFQKLRLCMQRLVRSWCVLVTTGATEDKRTGDNGLVLQWWLGRGQEKGTSGEEEKGEGESDSTRREEGMVSELQGVLRGATPPSLVLTPLTCQVFWAVLWLPVTQMLQVPLCFVLLLQDDKINIFHTSPDNRLF